MSRNINKKVDFQLSDATTLRTTCQVGYDMQGRIVARSNDSIIGQCYGRNENTGDVIQRLNFENLDFITLDRTDAQNLVDIISELMDHIYALEDGKRLDKSCDRSARDAELLGEKGISYERMFDYLNEVSFINHGE